MWLICSLLLGTRQEVKVRPVGGIGEVKLSRREKLTQFLDQLKFGSPTQRNERCLGDAEDLCILKLPDGLTLRDQNQVLECDMFKVYGEDTQTTIGRHTVAVVTLFT